MHDEIECPYCGHEFAFAGDPLDDDESAEEQCPHCEKHFMLTAQISVTYSTKEADCLNGGEHHWRPIIGAPREYFEGKERCQSCHSERNTKQPPQGGSSDGNHS